MRESEIKVGQFYRLINGKTVRVTSIISGIARVDWFSDVEKKWVRLAGMYPPVMFKELCDDPSTPSG